MLVFNILVEEIRFLFLKFLLISFLFSFLET